MILTVADLRSALQILDGDALVYLSRDSEGNGFNAVNEGSISSGPDVKDEDGNACIVIWSGYPQYVEIKFEEDEEDLIF